MNNHSDAPGLAGFSMPPETFEHEATLISWPTRTRVPALWPTVEVLDRARDAWAGVARVVAKAKRVIVVANEADAESAEDRCGEDVDVLRLPIDDSWIRDNGPIIVRNQSGERMAVHFGFNAWGNKYVPFDSDAAVAEPLAEYLGIPRVKAPFVLEGGSIAVDSAGTLITTERCLLNSNRNPDRTKEDLEQLLAAWLGVNKVVWLSYGMHEDDETDGHVDNVVAFVDEGRVVLQGCDDPNNPNYELAIDNRKRLEAAGIEIAYEIPVLPYVDEGGRGGLVPVPYANYYVANHLVVVPTCGHERDVEVLSELGRLYPDRQVVGVAGGVIGAGEGGVHCITQQVPIGNA